MVQLGGAKARPAEVRILEDNVNGTVIEFKIAGYDLKKLISRVKSILLLLYPRQQLFSKKDCHSSPESAKAS